MEHPAIAEVAVLGVPDETFGEVVTALVAVKQPPAGEEGAALVRPEVGELQRFCRDRLAVYQVRASWGWSWLSASTSREVSGWLVG